MYFDIYSVDLGVEVDVQIFDKKGFEDLKDYDLILANKRYIIRNYKAGQDEFGYLTDDIGRSDLFDYEWIKLNETVKLNVFYVDNRNDIIMSYILKPMFVEY